MMLHIASGKNKTTSTNVHLDDIQPNGIDLRVAKIFKINEELFLINEHEKHHRGSEEVKPWMNKGRTWYLDPGHYEVVMENQVVVGEGEAGFLIARSTLNRNGVFITSGLYDSGFAGALAGVMHVTIAPMALDVGTRIAQFLLFKAEMLHKYKGDYGMNADGTPKDMEKKYVSV